ncbi:AAA family ATPase [Paenibacillus chartarius]|uniref:Nuclease SbcCD subunit C n=1 Tax=Paenibacillus chartarius TaxID=747481 RepID=A0ABV6DHE2_9BACL
MRPITLQIAGLQSYRELQEIDFTQLTDAGVFGIFGPTGSGKSSVLDAITLALYGKVERAPNGTQGIINQAEQTMSVSFTFELSRPDGADRYRVERQFKRTGDVTVNQTVSRLLRFSPEGTVVLADKAGDVSAQVQELLGLSMPDFTRAVVLPQGKFAEFLTLTGKDRRMMLQRLFRLEAYGDQLAAKVAAKLKEAEVELKELAAEQQGLGDASAEALAAAAERVAEAERMVLQVREELAAAEAVYDELKQLVAWQREQADIDSQLERLREREPDVLRMEQRLALAEQAERLRPYVEQLAEAREQAQAGEARAAQAEAGYAEAERTASAARGGQETAAAALAEQEAALLARIGRLEQAVELELEVARLRSSAAALEQAAVQAEQRLAEVKAAVAKELELREKGLRRQAELKEQLGLCSVSVEESQTLQNAVQELQALSALEAGWREQVAELEQGRRSAAGLAAELRDAKLALEEQGADLLRSLAVNGPQERMLAQAERAAEMLLNSGTAAVQEGKRLREQAERHALAERLAAGLREGDPCPVCGSPHHPAPAAGGAGANEAADGGDLAERFLEEARELQLPLRQLAFRWRGAARQAAELLPEPVRDGWEQAAAALGVVRPEEERQAEAKLADVLLALLGDGKDSGHKREDSARAARNGPAGSGDIDAADAASADGDAAPAAAGVPFAAIVPAAERLTIDEAYRQLEALRQWLRAGERQAAALEAAAARAGSGLRQAERRAQELASRVEAAAELHRTLEAKAAAAESGLTLKREQWRERYPQLAGRDAAAELEALRAKERQAEDLRGRLEKSDVFLTELAAKLEQLQRQEAELDREALQLRTRLQGERQLAEAAQRQLLERLGGEEGRAEPLLAAARASLAALKSAAAAAQAAHERAQAALQRAAELRSAALEAREAAARRLAHAGAAWHAALAGGAGALGTEDAVKAAFLRAEDRSRWVDDVRAHREQERELRARHAQLEARRAGRSASEADWAAAQERLAAAGQRRDAALESRAKAARDNEELAAKHARWQELELRRSERLTRHSRLGKLQTVLRGNAFVEFLAEEQLTQVSRAASERLGRLTRQRYALEVDSAGGFVIRDDANGGVKRPVTTLSGGETFLTSLALALALSAQIQLKGEVPLEFFFLDEGFGTLDPELLETVIHALEKLHTDRLAVGVISHVAELRARLHRRLVVEPAEPSGRGSRVRLERL